MGYEKAQLDTLEIAWKRGYLSNTDHYVLLSRITGLNRKQISNWARGKIRKLGSAPLPSKNNTPDTNIAKSRDSKRFLEIAWNTGLLPGTENYTLIQDFTGLTRKQISNWSRTRVRKEEMNQISGRITTEPGGGAPHKVRKKSLNPEMARSAESSAATKRPIYTPELKWLLMNAVNGLEKVNEVKIGVLSTLIGFPRDEVRKFFLKNGRSVEDSYSVEQLALKQSTPPLLEKEAFLSSDMVSQPKELKIKTEKMEDSQKNVLSSTLTGAMLKS